MRPFQYISIIFIALLAALDVAYLAGIVSWWWLLILLVLYTATLVLGTIYIRWNFYLRSLHNDGKQKAIALTFDDGPAGETAAILDILKQHNIQAAFFTIGKRAAQNPDILRRLDTEGHVIGNHSYNHGFNFDWQSARKMTKEIEQANELVRSVTGKKPRLFRPPYGVTNPNLAEAVSRTGMHSIGWSIRSFDTKAKDPNRLLNRILDRLKGGDIILLHDSMPITREILTEFIVRAKKKGFTFARVDQLLDIDAYA